MIPFHSPQSPLLLPFLPVSVNTACLNNSKLIRGTIIFHRTITKRGKNTIIITSVAGVSRSPSLAIDCIHIWVISSIIPSQPLKPLKILPAVNCCYKKLRSSSENLSCFLEEKPYKKLHIYTILIKFCI